MTNLRNKNCRFFLVVISVLLSLTGSATTVSALDWGYDSAAPQNKGTVKPEPAFSENDQLKRQPKAKSVAAPAEGLSAKAGSLDSVGAAKSKATHAGKTITAASFAQPEVIDVDRAMRLKHARAESMKQNQSEVHHRLAQEWLDLYSLVAVEPLTAEQKGRFDEKLVKAAGLAKNADFESIEKFWPLVKTVCQAHPEQQANYHDLFRALFRLELRDPKANSIESDLVGEIIGPERVAVPDKPPLTEDAVEAYADMTCFIYNETHPGKTVDALDNRAVFVGTIEKRYMNSNSPVEKLAMSNFALKWSRFKILYADASEEDKAKLFKRISGALPESLSKGIHNIALEAVMSNGPWVRALTVKTPIGPTAPKTETRESDESAGAAESRDSGLQRKLESDTTEPNSTSGPSR